MPLIHLVDLLATSAPCSRSGQFLAAILSTEIDTFQHPASQELTSPFCSALYLVERLFLRLESAEITSVLAFTAAEFNTSASLKFEIRKPKNEDVRTPEFPEVDAYVEQFRHCKFLIAKPRRCGHACSNDAVLPSGFSLILAC